MFVFGIAKCEAISVAQSSRFKNYSTQCVIKANFKSRHYKIKVCYIRKKSS